MKKILAMILAMAMLCAVCCALAEETNQSLFATVGEAIDASAETPMQGGDAEHYIVTLEKDGKYLRVVADLDDSTRALGDAIGTTDDFEAELAAYEAAVRALPVTYVEEFAMQPKAQEELDALVGKTVQELEDAGFYTTSSGTEGEAIVFSMADGIFEYDFEVEADFDEYTRRQETDDFGTLVTKSAKFRGLSMLSLELRFHADGTVEEQEDPFAAFSDMMQAISDAVETAKNGGEVDVDAVVNALTAQFPEEEANIRAMVEMILLMGNTEGE